MASDKCFDIATYNLHGIKWMLWFEHWLHDNNLYILNSIHPDFVGIGISSMSERFRTDWRRNSPTVYFINTRDVGHISVI